MLNTLTDQSQRNSDLNLIELSGSIPMQFSGKRLDQTLAIIYPSYSREDLKRWILNGACLIDHKILPPKYKVRGGESFKISTKLPDRNLAWQPENLPLTILYEDPAILVIDKPCGLVVHPGAGNWQGTLLNALIYHYPNLTVIPRAGILHRLDQDTTGVMVIAKTLPAYNFLLSQFKQRTVLKTYLAVVIGKLIAGGTIDLPIGRDPKQRVKMAVNANGRPAITHYRVIETFNNKYTYLKLNIETGRTHQIRVHMQHLGYPILGDRLYARSYTHPNKFFLDPPRQALHAKSLTFVHPQHKQTVTFTSPLPTDLNNLLINLQSLACSNNI